MESNRKHSWFFSFKSVFQAEKYLKVMTDKWNRLIYTRFRLRTLGLSANKRWFQPGTSTDLPCPMCGYNVENEIHFLFQCKAYDSIRDKCEFFSLDVAKRQDIVFILSSYNEHIIKSVAKFVAEAVKIRQNQVNSSCVASS